MAWEKPYVILRTDGNGTLGKVHEAEMIKDARYWLSYIAQPGDAIFQTPAHPKHETGEKLLYKAHLISRGKVGYDEAEWIRIVGKDGKAPSLPE